MIPTLQFQIQKKVNFGQAIYISGNIKELGEWSIDKSIRLEWSQNNIWKTQKISINLPQQKKILYKYFIGNFSNVKSQEPTWENGSNRELIMAELQQSNNLINDVWDHNLIYIRLESQDESEQIYIFTNILNKYQKLKKNIQKQYYDILLKVPLHFKYVIYRVGYKDPHSNFIVTDRINRKIELQKKEFYDKYHQSLNIIKVVDKIKELSFVYSQVNENIIVGQYPQSANDISTLVDNGVKAVLNLQTESEIQNKGQQLQELLGLYEKFGIKFVNYQISDMCEIDMQIKIYPASQLLNQLIVKYSKVFIHCSAGIYRSPEVVIGYLHFIKKMNITNAISLVEAQHPISRKNKQFRNQIFRSIISNYSQFTNSEQNDQNQNQNCLKNESKRNKLQLLLDEQFGSILLDQNRKIKVKSKKLLSSTA